MVWAAANKSSPSVTTIHGWLKPRPKRLLFMALGLPQKYDIFFIKMQINLNTKSYAAFQVISEHDGDRFGHAAQEHVNL